MIAPQGAATVRFYTIPAMGSEVHGLIIWVHIHGHGYFQDVSSPRNPGGAPVKAKDGISFDLQVRMWGQSQSVTQGCLLSGFICVA